jgi:hypothetical protein
MISRCLEYWSLSIFLSFSLSLKECMYSLKADYLKVMPIAVGSQEPFK